MTNGLLVSGLACPEGNPDEFANRAFRIMMCGGIRMGLYCPGASFVALGSVLLHENPPFNM